MLVSDPELVRKTWKGMVDTRNAYKRRGKIRSGSADVICKWPLAASMAFLDNYNLPMSTTSNIQSDDDDEEPGEEAPVHDEVTTPVCSETLHDQPTPNKFRRQRGKRTKTDPVEDTLISMLRKDAEEDEDKGFFMSLYKDFKTLPDDKKIEAKMALMEALYNVKRGVGRMTGLPQMQSTSSAAAPIAPVTGAENVALITISPSKYCSLLGHSLGQ